VASSILLVRSQTKIHPRETIDPNDLLSAADEEEPTVDESSPSTPKRRAR
jgi:hypothetical protein